MFEFFQNFLTSLITRKMIEYDMEASCKNISEIRNVSFIFQK